MVTGRTSRNLAWLAIVTTLAGCAGSRGFDREAMRATFHHDPEVRAEQTIDAAPAAKPTVAVPFKLALYFVQKQFPNRQAILNAEWLSADKDALVRQLAPLLEERIVSDFFLLADSTIQGANVR